MSQNTTDHGLTISSINSRSWDKVHLDRSDHLNRSKEAKCCLKISTCGGHHIFLNVLIWCFWFTKCSSGEKYGSKTRNKIVVPSLWHLLILLYLHWAVYLFLDWYILCSIAFPTKVLSVWHLANLALLWFTLPPLVSVCPITSIICSRPFFVFAEQRTIWLQCPPHPQCLFLLHLQLHPPNFISESFLGILCYIPFLQLLVNGRRAITALYFLKWTSEKPIALNNNTQHSCLSLVMNPKMFSLNILSLSYHSLCRWLDSHSPHLFLSLSEPRRHFLGLLL